MLCVARCLLVLFVAYRVVCVVWWFFCDLSGCCLRLIVGLWLLGVCCLLLHVVCDVCMLIFVVCCLLCAV